MDVVELGVIEVTTSRPFRVEGMVVLGGAWKGLESNVWQLKLVAVLQPGSRRRRVTEKAIPLRASGGVIAFKWACETPEDRVVLELRGPSGAVVQETLWPVPDTDAQVELRFPE